MRLIVCHYAEIGIKGKNRKLFEETLVWNIKKGLARSSPGSITSVKRISGRILVHLTKQGEHSLDTIVEILSQTFGLAYIAPALRIPARIKNIKEAAQKLIDAEKHFRTFKIDARRSDKSFSLQSPKINEEIGEHIVKMLRKKVKLKDPEITCTIEIVEGHAYIFTKKIRGPGGLPVGISGKTLIMLSGGIDSPISAYYMLKRGSPVSYIHFHSLPYTSPASVEKTKELAEILSKFQPRATKLYLVPFYPIQKEIMLHTPAQYRVVLYRRFMFSIAEEIAKIEKALSLITGEALGQVASQTLENISVIQEGIKIPVLRPLIGFDKEEIIKKAKEIRTYEISILPHEDCCSLFIPKSPATKARLPDIKKAETALDKKVLIENTIKNIRVEEVCG